MKPTKLKLDTHMDSGWMYRVYRNQNAAAYLSLYFSIFLSLIFSTLNIFVTLFSGTVRPKKLKLGTHMDSGWMYSVYHSQTAAAYLSLYLFFFLSNFQMLQFFVTVFSGTVRPTKSKLGTHMSNGWMYHVYRNQDAVAYLSLYYFIFFFSNSQSLKILPAPVAHLVECPLLGTGSHGFDPGPQHTKVVKMVLAAHRLALRLRSRAWTG